MAQAGQIIGGGASAVGIVDPWTPWAIPRSVLKTWFSADDLTASPVVTWTSRINALSPTQATGGSQPTWASNNFNSLASVVCDGTDDQLTVSSIGSLAVGTATGWIYASVSADAAVSGSIFSIGATGANAQRSIRNVVSGGVSRATITDGTTALSDATVDFGGINAIGGIWDTAVEYGYINGAPFSTPSAATAFNTSSTRTRIGASAITTANSFWNGKIRHIISGVGNPTTITLPGRSTSLHEDLMGWLLWDCGQQSKLPANHPWRYVAPWQSGADIVILTGQSNTVGKGTGSFVWSTTTEYDNRVFQVGRFGANDMQIIPAAPEPLEFFNNEGSTQHGYGLSLGRKIAAAIPVDRVVILVPVARGGTSILKWTGTISPDLYPELAERVRVALAYPGNNRIVLWSEHQGEADIVIANDAGDPLHALMPDANAYYAKKLELIARFRAEFGANIPMLFGKYTTGWLPGDPVKAAFETALDNVCGAVPLCAVVSTTGLVGSPTSEEHFTAAEQETLSGRHMSGLTSLGAP